MSMKLREFWKTRSPRERGAIAAVILIAGAALYLWLVHSADLARTRLHAAVMTLRAQAAGLEQQAIELGRLRTAPAAPRSPTDLRSLLQAQAGSAGLSSVLGRIEARDANQVQVVFGAVAFADWLAWVGTLQSLQVRLDACRIESLSTAGLVSVTATFVRAQPQ